MTVTELLERISSRELSEWMAFSQLEPFGADASYLGHAITASTVANVNRAKGQKAYSADDFMPRFEEKKPQSQEEMIQFAAMYIPGLRYSLLKPQSQEEMIQFAAMYTAALGGEDKRKEK